MSHQAPERGPLLGAVGKRKGGEGRGEERRGGERKGGQGGSEKKVEGLVPILADDGVCHLTRERAGGNPAGILSVAQCETLQPVLYAVEEVGRARGACHTGSGASAGP